MSKLSLLNIDKTVIRSYILDILMEGFYEKE